MGRSRIVLLDRPIAWRTELQRSPRTTLHDATVNHSCEFAMLPFWIDPSCLSLTEITVALAGLAVVVNTLLGRAA